MLAKRQPICTGMVERKLAKNLEINPFDIDVRIESKIEWIFVAKAAKSENVYGWNGLFLRNAVGKFMANLIQVFQVKILYLIRLPIPIK